MNFSVFLLNYSNTWLLIYFKFEEKSFLFPREFSNQQIVLFPWTFIFSSYNFFFLMEIIFNFVSMDFFFFSSLGIFPEFILHLRNTGLIHFSIFPKHFSSFSFNFHDFSTAFQWFANVIHGWHRVTFKLTWLMLFSQGTRGKTSDNNTSGNFSGQSIFFINSWDFSRNPFKIFHNHDFLYLLLFLEFSHLFFFCFFFQNIL